MNRPLLRPGPATPVTGMQTYAVTSPRATHTRPGTCPEVGCLHHRRGWATTVLAGSQEERDLLRGCRGDIDGYRRPFRRRVDDPGPGFVRYVFEAGTACFRIAQHRVPLERPPLYVVRGGDWRAHTGVIRKHTGPDAWVNDFGEHQDRIARAVNGSPQ